MCKFLPVRKYARARVSERLNERATVLNGIVLCVCVYVCICVYVYTAESKREIRCSVREKYATIGDERMNERVSEMKIKKGDRDRKEKRKKKRERAKGRKRSLARALTYVCVCTCVADSVYGSGA